MECEEIDTIAYSHQKLSTLLENVTDPESRDKIVTNFIESSNNDSIDEFPKDLEWFNVSQHLSVKNHLKGKVVVLDFFTYCCINCMHILPDLKEIENEFSIKDGLVVIGVHSAKFDNEKNSNNIQAAVQRYNISHPVVNDSEALIWNKCEVNCWPTLLLLGPDSNPIIMMMGEGHKDDLHLYIRNALRYFKLKNKISSHSLPITPSFHYLPDLKGPLLFPGKITNLINKSNDVEKLAISDTGNHRILIALSDGTILKHIGNGQGYKDGPFFEAKFNSPQGLAFLNDYVLFVADTENHAIRKIDLQHGMVSTVAGTGVQGIDRTGGKEGKEQEISSPWDVCIYKTPDMDMSFHLPNESIEEREVLLIAMAGTHQIWALFFQDTIWWKFKKYLKGTCVCIAGSGKEENRNNAYPLSASFAQPSGIALCKEKKEVYIADSESSSIRRLSLIDGKVTGIVGGDRNPNNLFAFGDIDGTLCEAKLQHALGVCMAKDENLLYVTDTYNHKLKIINTLSNSISSILLPKVNVSNDSDVTFNEPSGLCVSVDGSKLYIADTNNHCIKIVHMSTEHAIKKIIILNLKSTENKHLKFDKIKLKIPARKFVINAHGGKIILICKTVFKDNLKLTTSAPQQWSVLLPSELWSCVPQNGTDITNVDTVINLLNVSETKTQHFYLQYNFVACKDIACIPKAFALEFTVEYSENGPIHLEETLNVEISDSGVVCC